MKGRHFELFFFYLFNSLIDKSTLLSKFMSNQIWNEWAYVYTWSYLWSQVFIHTHTHIHTETYLNRCIYFFDLYFLTISQ